MAEKPKAEVVVEETVEVKKTLKKTLRIHMPEQAESSQTKEKALQKGQTDKQVLQNPSEADRMKAERIRERRRKAALKAHAARRAKMRQQYLHDKALEAWENKDLRSALEAVVGHTLTDAAAFEKLWNMSFADYYNKGWLGDSKKRAYEKQMFAVNLMKKILHLSPKAPLGRKRFYEGWDMSLGDLVENTFLTEQMNERLEREQAELAKALSAAEASKMSRDATIVNMIRRLTSPDISEVDIRRMLRLRFGEHAAQYLKNQHITPEDAYQNPQVRQIMKYLLGRSAEYDLTLPEFTYHWDLSIGRIISDSMATLADAKEVAVRSLSPTKTLYALPETKVAQALPPTKTPHALPETKVAQALPPTKTLHALPESKKEASVLSNMTARPPVVNNLPVQGKKSVLRNLSLTADSQTWRDYGEELHTMFMSYVKTGHVGGRVYPYEVFKKEWEETFGAFCTEMTGIKGLTPRIAYNDSRCITYYNRLMGLPADYMPAYNEFSPLWFTPMGDMAKATIAEHRKGAIVRVQEQTLKTEVAVQRPEVVPVVQTKPVVTQAASTEPAVPTPSTPVRVYKVKEPRTDGLFQDELYLQGVKDPRPSVVSPVVETASGKAVPAEENWIQDYLPVQVTKPLPRRYTTENTPFEADEIFVQTSRPDKVPTHGKEGSLRAFLAMVGLLGLSTLGLGWGLWSYLAKDKTPESKPHVVVDALEMPEPYFTEEVSLPDETVTVVKPKVTETAGDTRSQTVAVPQVLEPPARFPQINPIVLEGHFDAFRADRFNHNYGAYNRLGNRADALRSELARRAMRLYGRDVRSVDQAVLSATQGMLTQLARDLRTTPRWVSGTNVSCSLLGRSFALTKEDARDCLEFIKQAGHAWRENTHNLNEQEKFDVLVAMKGNMMRPNLGADIALDGRRWTESELNVKVVEARIAAGKMLHDNPQQSVYGVTVYALAEIFLKDGRGHIDLSKEPPPIMVEVYNRLAQEMGTLTRSQQRARLETAYQDSQRGLLGRIAHRVKSM